MIAEKNRVYMDTAIENTFYVFDEEGKFLCFHRYPVTNLYQLDIEQTNEGDSELTTITRCTQKTMKDNIPIIFLSTTMVDKIAHP